MWCSSMLARASPRLSSQEGTSLAQRGVAPVANDRLAEQGAIAVDGVALAQPRLPGASVHDGPGLDGQGLEASPVGLDETLELGWRTQPFGFPRCAARMPALAARTRRAAAMACSRRSDIAQRPRVGAPRVVTRPREPLP